MTQQNKDIKEYEYCERCKQNSAKRELAGKLSDNIEDTWRCGCGVVFSKPTQQNKDKEIVKEFDKYGKEYIIESEPEDYIHKGLDSSFQFSDFKSDISKALQQVREEERREVVEEIKKTMRESDMLTKMSSCTHEFMYKIINKLNK